MSTRQPGAASSPAQAFLQTASSLAPTSTRASSSEGPTLGAAAGGDTVSVSAEDLEKFAASSKDFSIKYSGYTGYHGLCNPQGMYLPYQTVSLPRVADAADECSTQAKCGAFSTSSQIGGYTVSFWERTLPVQHGSAAAGDTSGTCFIHSHRLNRGYEFHRNIAKQVASADVTIVS